LNGIFVPNGPGLGNYSSPVYYNGNVYFAPVDNTVQKFSLTNGLLSTATTSQSSETYGYPGGMMAISADGITNGILWVVEDTGTTTPGVLHAYLASNLADELYNSSQAGSRDTMDLAAKFSMPLVANGRVYVGGVTQLTVYGLLPASPPAAPMVASHVTTPLTTQTAQPAPDAAGGSNVNSGVSIAANQASQAPVPGFIQQQTETVAEALAAIMGLVRAEVSLLELNVSSGLRLLASLPSLYRNPLFLEALARVHQDDSLSTEAASSGSDLAIVDALFASLDM
jgi:hypothetical protein